VLGAAAVVAALLLGFVVFASVATRSGEPDAGAARADGIVVLTGGGARIGEAARLLRDGRGKRLLISGVNRAINRGQLQRLTALDPRIFECCVDVGYAALNTTGNADETRAWVHSHGYRTVIVVTASYHMPRSIAELQHALPGTQFVPHPVRPPGLEQQRWWLHRTTARVLASEYVKLLSSAARLLAQRFLGTTADPVVATDGQGKLREAKTVGQ